MFIGYVSNEMYEAVQNATVEFRKNDEICEVVHSSATGAINADIEPGTYNVIIKKKGYGGKRTKVPITPEISHDFRLQSIKVLGYIWPKWVKTDESAQYRIHSPEETRISLWRYGKEKEFIRLLDWHDEHGPHTCLQKLPDGDFTQTGVKWNKEGYEYVDPGEVPAPDESGLYYFHLETLSGDCFSFPWVVAPAEPDADIAVLSATNTWNAYNDYGGRSNYINTGGLPDKPVVHARSELDRYTIENGEQQAEDHEYPVLSFERPCLFNSISPEQDLTDPIRGKEGSHTAPAEWRFLGWLEREEYNYDLYSDMQLHTGDLALNSYDTLIIHTHPEYWSYKMFEKVKTWVEDEGGKLMYLGGNGVNAEVEVVDESRIRYMNNSENVRSDVSLPKQIPDDSYESRFHRSTGESEGSLLGVVFTESGIKRAAPYEVQKPGHWIFEGTDLEEGDTFGQEVLQERCSGGASGHETDKLSKNAPKGTSVVAKGTNENHGGGEIIYYETESGGEVYSAGSITYPTALLVDDSISKITSNVINKFISE